MVCIPTPNGFADHYPYEKWLAIIGKINPTFSDKPKYCWVVAEDTVPEKKKHVQTNKYITTPWGTCSVKAKPSLKLR